MTEGKRLSREDCVGNRNTNIMGKLAIHMFKSTYGIFDDLPFPKETQKTKDHKGRIIPGRTFSSPEEFFMWEHGWQPLEVYTKAYRNLRSILGPKAYDMGGGSVSKLSSWGMVDDLKYVWNGPIGALENLPELNTFFNDTKDFIIYLPPKESGNELTAQLIIRPHDDQDPHDDWISDPHINAILRQIPCVWGGREATVKQPLVPYELEKLCRREPEFRELDLDPWYNEDVLTILDPLLGKRIKFAERVGLQEDKNFSHEFLCGDPVFTGYSEKRRNTDNPKYTGFKTIRPLKTNHVTLIPEGTILRAPDSPGHNYYLIDFSCQKGGTLKSFFYPLVYKALSKKKLKTSLPNLLTQITQESRAKSLALEEKENALKARDDAFDELELAHRQLEIAHSELEKINLELEARVESRTYELTKSNEELSQAIKEIQDKDSTLLQVSKMAAIGDLSSGISHQYNNVTRTIEESRVALIDAITIKDKSLELLFGSGIPHEDKKLILAIGEQVIEYFSDHSPLLPDDVEDLSEELVDRFINENVKDAIVNAENITSLQLNDLILDKDLGSTSNYEEKIIELVKEGNDFVVDLLISYQGIADHNRTIKIANDRLFSTSRSLKQFSRNEQTLTSNVDIHEGIETILDIMDSHLKGIEVLREFSAPPIECYGGILLQVYQNLISNASQAMGGKGLLRIKTYELDENYIKFEIEDTGCGIPEQNIERLFDPYFTTKDKSQGSGMGLKMSYDIIMAHKGRIDVESKLGKGSKFSITLPKNQKDNGVKINLYTKPLTSD